MLTNDSSKNIEGSAGYAHGRRDGLRLALAVLASEEAKWATLLGESASWRTNVTREVRHKTLQVAQNRLKTALNRITPKVAAPPKSRSLQHWMSSAFNAQPSRRCDEERRTACDPRT